MRIAKPVLGLGLALALAGLYLGGLDAIPFHPDESTQAYMSRDFDLLALQRDTGALAWSPDAPLTPEMRYRLLDAPAARYLAGLAWWLRGLSAADLNADWMWGVPWEANQAALPRPEVLLAARTLMAALGALACAGLFVFGRMTRGACPRSNAEGAAVGLAAAALLALDPLMLLHTRRSMAEAPLLFFSVLAALGLLLLGRACDARAGAGRLLAAAAGEGALLGLAASSKQSALALFPAALGLAALALWQRPGPRVLRARDIAGAWAALTLGFGLIFWALNPFLHGHPWQALQRAVTLRAELIEEQVRVNGLDRPEQVLATPAARLGAALDQVYFRPPAAWDAPVYLDQLQPQADQYFAQPLAFLFLRQTPFGVLLALLSLLGAAASAVRLASNWLGPETRAEQALWLWTGATLAFTLLALPLDWQRYFLPLLPPSRVFAALGLSVLAEWGRARLAGRSLEAR